MKTQKELIHRVVEEKRDRDYYLKTYAMKHIKIDGFFEEFPWLDKYLSNRYEIGQLYVSRIEPSILELQRLERTVLCGNWFFSEKSIMRERILFLDERGEMIAIVEEVGETVGDAIHRISAFNAKRIAFIVSFFQYTDAVIIYKSPAGISVPKWIEKQIADEKAMFHAEVEAIDAEYTPPKPLEGPPNRVAKPSEYGFCSHEERPPKHSFE